MKLIIKSSLYLLLMTVLLGGAYTAVVTATAQAFFPFQANGSVIEAGGKKYSLLIGQNFREQNHLWGRPMNIDTETFKGGDNEKLLYSWPTNMSPAGEKFAAAVEKRVAGIKAAHPEMGSHPVPAELVTVSGSGLDPHISPSAAEYQVLRIAKSSGKSEEYVRKIISSATDKPFLGIIGEARVNVLLVNLKLDGIIAE